MVTGSPGGRTIPNTMLWAVVNLLDFGWRAAAVDLPGLITSGSPIETLRGMPPGRSIKRHCNG